MEKENSGVWTALFTLVAALAAAASTPALADKGGRGLHLGMPNTNLGLSKFHRAGVGAGPFVPAPGLQVAPGLMRGPLGNGGVPSAGAHGLTPPGHLATPGLRLGHTNGVLPTVPDPNEPGNGLALGNGNDFGNGNVQGAAQGPVAATDRIAAPSPVDGRNTSPGSEAMPRQLPTCR